MTTKKDDEQLHLTFDLTTKIKIWRNFIFITNSCLQTITTTNELYTRMKNWFLIVFFSAKRHTLDCVLFLIFYLLLNFYWFSFLFFSHSISNCSNRPNRYLNQIKCFRARHYGRQTLLIFSYSNNTLWYKSKLFIDHTKR